MRYFIIFLMLLVSGSAFASDHEKSKGIMTPLPSERLTKPISLKQVCKKVKIVEWRGTPGLIKSTGPSKKSINILNKSCNMMVPKFFEFMKNQYGDYKLENKNYAFDTSISFMPYIKGKQGHQPRNLNDIKYRFVYRPKTYTDGEVDIIWGFFQRAEDWMYVRNDVLLKDGKTKNKETEKVFIHEMFHAMSWHYKVYHQHSGNKDHVEEKMAREFTTYLKLGR